MTATTPTAVDAPPRSGRIFDTGRLEALEPELQKYNVEVPSSPDDPAFETVLAQLGASHPDLARQLAAAVTDELGDQARAKFQQAATRGDRKNLLARKASSAVKTTNHKGRPQFNPLAFKIIGGVVFLGVIAGILLAPVPETDTAKEATTANLGEPPLPPDGTETGNQPGNAEGGTSPTTPGNGGTPTPAESITPAPSPPGSTGLAVDANGRPLSSGASSGAPTSPTSLNTTETPSPCAHGCRSEPGADQRPRGVYCGAHAPARLRAACPGGPHAAAHGSRPGRLTGADRAAGHGPARADSH
ncbi:hypothetical protein [Deinococcus multiflagellatus]|uniref:Uncharacterized protein n=1 Tax=Deinococcus multiflagellatus TaxID=1656887 RepID=A0ABW1ZV50_9DEIO